MLFRKRDKGQQRRIRTAQQRGAQPGQCTRTANASANILKLWSALWALMTGDALAPTPNAAEQALRSSVLERKISAAPRTLRGDQFLARRFSDRETRLRQVVDLWGFVDEVLHAFVACTQCL